MALPITEEERAASASKRFRQAFLTHLQDNPPQTGTLRKKDAASPEALAGLIPAVSERVFQHHLSHLEVEDGRVLEVRGEVVSLLGLDVSKIRLRIGKRSVEQIPGVRVDYTGQSLVYRGIEPASHRFSCALSIPRGTHTAVLEARLPWKIWVPFFACSCRRAHFGAGGELLAAGSPPKDFDCWFRKYGGWSAEDAERAAREIKGWSSPPRFAVVSSEADEEGVRRSLGEQIYPHWEYVAKRGGDWNLETLLRESNADYVLFLEKDARPLPHALFAFARKCAAQKEAPALLYADEAEQTPAGRWKNPAFKPDWNPDLLLAAPYIGNCCAFRREFLQKLLPFPDAPSIWALALEAIRHCSAEQVSHLSFILSFHPHSSRKANVLSDAQLEVLHKHAGQKPQRGFRGLGAYIPWPLPEKAPLVSIVIPTRDRIEILRVCIESIREKTTWPDYEILIVDNDSEKEESLAQFREWEESGICVLKHAGPFNYAAINNYGVQQAKGEIITLLNNDIEVISPDWLTEMVRHALRKDIGGVGARLLFPNDSIQHAGVIMGGDMADHAFRFHPAEEDTYGNRAELVQNFSALTAACLTFRKTLFEEAGGFDEENLAVTFNDIDLCLKFQEAGCRNLYTPFAELYHHESLSRGCDDVSPEKKARARRELEFMQNKWPHLIARDPAYNLNLAETCFDFEPAWPPRVSFWENSPLT